jgi:hypothetical protein
MNGCYISAVTLANAADWHAARAIAAYRKRNYAVYRKHIRIADELRRV